MVKTKIENTRRNEIGDYGLHYNEKTYNYHITRINEFSTFRNELFHDRYFENPQVYHHTSFCEIAPNLNIVDVMQAMAITTEVCILLSKLITGLDLTPQLNINWNWLRFDDLFDEVIILFNRILDKHNLSTDLSLNINKTSYKSYLFTADDDVSVIVLAKHGSNVMSYCDTSTNFLVIFKVGIHLN